MEKQKRERNVNFTEEETNLLVSLAETKKHIIENKKSDAATWKNKEKAWKYIETAFNATSRSAFRDHKHLKLKYEAMKRDIRKKSALIRSAKTGGGKGPASVLTAAEQRVKEIILLSLEGNKSTFDCMPCRPVENRPFHNLIEEKIQIAKIQKQIVTEELEQKIIHRKILEKELEHKCVMHGLEKQHILLKIELLKKNLGEN